MNEVNQNTEFVEKILVTAQSFLDEQKYVSAKDIYSEVTIQYPDRYEGWYGYIKAITENFTKLDISRRFISNVREDKEKMLKLCTDEKIKEQLDSEIEDYLDLAYDELQTRLEVINADAEKLHTKQIAQEQLAKKKYKDSRKKIKRNLFISIALLVLFCVSTILSLMYLVMWYTGMDQNTDAQVPILLGIVMLLVCFISAILIFFSIRSVVRSRRRLINLKIEYEETQAKISKKYNKEYKNSQLEYDELDKE